MSIMPIDYSKRLEYELRRKPEMKDIVVTVDEMRKFASSCEFFIPYVKEAVANGNIKPN